MIYRVGAVPEVALTGGCARNMALVKSLEASLGIPVIRTKEDPQIAGALGAALFAQAKALVQNR
jgi:activator of 2-hydroxyglutaryl-CoA dehydratase